MLQHEILSASLTADTQAAISAQGKEQLWEGTYNTSTIKMEQALLKRAQSPALLQHIQFKQYDLSKHVLRAIASRPNVIIVGADGYQSTVRTLFPSAEQTLVQQVSRAAAVWAGEMYIAYLKCTQQLIAHAPARAASLYINTLEAPTALAYNYFQVTMLLQKIMSWPVQSEACVTNLLIGNTVNHT